MTGYPIREAIAGEPARRAALAEEARAALDLDAERRTVVVIGGSQGAQHLNEVVAGAVAPAGTPARPPGRRPDRAEAGGASAADRCRTRTACWCGRSRSSNGWSSRTRPPTSSSRARARRRSRSWPSAGSRPSWCPTRMRPRTIRRRTLGSSNAPARRRSCSTASSRPGVFAERVSALCRRPGPPRSDGRMRPRAGQAGCRGAIRAARR